MTDVNLELKKAIINHAHRNKDISQSHYEELMNILESEMEELRLQKKLKEYSEREFIEKYKELSLTWWKSI